MEELEPTDTRHSVHFGNFRWRIVNRYFGKSKPATDAIRDSIENCAEDVCRAKEELGELTPRPSSIRCMLLRLIGEMAVQYNTFS